MTIFGSRRIEPAGRLQRHRVIVANQLALRRERGRALQAGEGRTVVVEPLGGDAARRQRVRSWRPAAEHEVEQRRRLGEPSGLDMAFRELDRAVDVAGHRSSSAAWTIASSPRRRS